MAAMDLSVSVDDLFGAGLARPEAPSTAAARPPVPASAAPADPCSCSQNLARGEKPEPLDLTHLYAETTKQRVASKMKEYYKFFLIPNIGNLAGGLPNVQFFPYDTLEAKIAKPERWTPSPNKQSTVDSDDDGDTVLVTDRVAAVNLTAAPSDRASPCATLASAAAAGSPSDRAAPAHLVIPKNAPAGVTPDKKIDLATALQYGSADGYPPLLAWVRAFTRQQLHPDVPYKGGPDVVLTVGSTDGFSKTLELFVDDWSPSRNALADRPGLLCETFVYGNVLSQIAPKGMQVVPVEADAGGMVAHGPGSLEDVLANWDPATGRRPHMMYTVTMGHNPTGIVLSTERRRQLYAVCSRFDVVIVEDDPYWYLQYPSAAINEAASRGLAKPKSPLVPPPAPAGDGAADTGRTSSGFAFLDSLVPSFLSIDVDGRVVRLDTFSKTVAPGCRLGWITAQPALIERFTRIAETGTQQPSGFVQSLISELVMGPLPAATEGHGGADGQTAPAKPATGLFGQRALSLGNSSSSSSSSKHKQAAEPSFGGWRVAGWVRWLEGLRGEYERRMNRLATILDEGAFQLKQGTPVRSADADWGVITKTRLYSFDWPRGGMFLWLRMHFETHPLWHAPRPDAGAAAAAAAAAAPVAEALGMVGGAGAAGAAGAVLDGPVLALALMIFLTTKPYLVLVSPGSMFSATDDIRLARGWAYLRICFAAETDENIELCSQRLVAAIHKFWKIKNVEDLEEILRNSPAALADMAAAGQRGQLGNMGTWLGC